MRIAFVIGNFVMNTGIGGHYYSLLTTAEALATAGHDVVVLCIGNRMSPVVEAWKGDHRFVPASLFSPIRAVQTLHDFVREWKPDFLHAFDLQAALFARLAALRTGTKYVLTVCGGPPPKMYFPRILNVATFSIELQEYFTRAAVPNLHLIPNRVYRFEPSEARLRALGELVDADSIKILRIARINEFYLRSILQTINLASALRRHGFPAQAVVIGEVTDTRIEARVRSALAENDLLITDTGMTRDAKRVIDVADFVVGTGRSFMEAASRARVMFCPSKNYDLPILVTPETFDDAFRSNFSERVVTSSSYEDNWNRIQAVAGNASYRRSLSEFCLDRFEQHFNGDRIAEKYMALYNEYVAPSRSDTLEVVVHCASFAKTCLRFWLKSRGARPAGAPGVPAVE